MDCSLLCSSVYGILQARILEWVAIPFFRGSSQARDRSLVSWIAGRFFTIWATGETLQLFLVRWISLLLIHILYFPLSVVDFYDSHTCDMWNRESESHSVVSDSLWHHGLYSPWNSQGQNTGVCSLSLFQGIFPTQGSNPGLLHCRQILNQLSHKGSLIFEIKWLQILKHTSKTYYQISLHHIFYISKSKHRKCRNWIHSSNIFQYKSQFLSKANEGLIVEACKKKMLPKLCIGFFIFMDSRKAFYWENVKLINLIFNTSCACAILCSFSQPAF